MQAKVKAKTNMRTVQAFTGREYVGYEWRDVPAGCEAQASKHPFLDVREEAQPEAEEAQPEPKKAGKK